MDNNVKKTRKLATTSLLLMLVALVFVITVTVAWFSIADNTKLYTMGLDVTTGVSLRFDLDPHADFFSYFKMLSFADIADRIRRDDGYDPRETEMIPVTTLDAETFTLQNGTVEEGEKGEYLTFTLHFMATQDMIVHLTSISARGEENGTKVRSKIANLPEAMRVSFTVDGQTFIYDPGEWDNDEFSYKISENVRVFRLPSADKMVYNLDNALFALSANQDKAVVVHVWLEGTDEKCTNELKGGDYQIWLRFEGTDEEGNRLEATRPS